MKVTLFDLCWGYPAYNTFETNQNAAELAAYMRDMSDKSDGTRIVAEGHGDYLLVDHEWRKVANAPARCQTA